MSHGVLTLTKMNLNELNDLFRRIQEALDGIEGIRGEFERGRWTFNADGITVEYRDSNGQLLHGFGDV